MFYIILAPPSEKLQAASDFNDITITQDSFGAKKKKKRDGDNSSRCDLSDGKVYLFCSRSYESLCRAYHIQTSGL